MNYEHLLVTQENDIARLTINRPKALNALNKQVFTDLLNFFSKDGPSREGLRGVIITGAGDRAFVAGADIKEFLDFGSEGAAKVSKRGQDIFFLIEGFHVPVIAAVNGFALGGGCELAMACHIRVAGEYAKFGQPEVNLGIIPGYGGTQRLIQLIGKGKATEMLLTGDMIKAEEALRLGLVTHVVPAGEEVNKAIEIMEKIKLKAPIAITNVIRCVNKYFEASMDGFDYEVANFGKTSNSQDFIEGAKAFMEKRKPDFKGV
ncbi:MAG TPA: enoyl-CoA hydratase [Phaeodactylibacter sp.]|nr:enoyl-CoA hydratase [Phaeodactylibacter sp.]